MTFKFPVALATVIVFQAWRYFPFAFLFLLARLQAVPEDLDEAARVDGATPTPAVPLHPAAAARGVIGLLVVLRFIWTFNEFDDIYLLTGGGGGTEVVSVRIFNQLTGRGDIGASAALALILAALLCVLLFVYFRRNEPRRVHAVSGSSRPLTREVVETRILRVLWWVGVVFFLVVTVVPFAYRFMLSIRTIESVAADPGALIPPLNSITFDAYGEVLQERRGGWAGLPRVPAQQRGHRDGGGGRVAPRRDPGRLRSRRDSGSSAGARSARCSWPSTCSRRSCWRSRCS